MNPVTLLTDEDRRLLMKVSSLLEELLETLEVLEDRELLYAIREAEEDHKAGRVWPYGEAAREERVDCSHPSGGWTRPT